MKRQTYAVTLTVDHEVISTDTAYAFNSGIRKSEGLAREYARTVGMMLTGGKPEVTGDKYARTSYRRVWTGGSIDAVAEVSVKSHAATKASR